MSTVTIGHGIIFSVECGKVSFSVSAKMIVPLGMVTVPLAVLFAMSAAYFSCGTPDFSYEQTQSGLLVTSVGQSKGDIRPGDRIVAINGLAYDSVLSALCRGIWTPVKVDRLTVVRSGKRIDVSPVHINGTPFSYLAASWPYLLIVVAFLLPGMVVCRRDTTRHPGRLLFLMLCSFATMVAALLPDQLGILQPSVISASFVLTTASSWVAFGSWTHFVCRFPAERDLFAARKRWPIGLFYLLPPLVSLLGVLAASHDSRLFWGTLLRMRYLCVPMIIAVALGKHLADYFSLPTSFAKNQLKLSLAAYWLVFGPYLFLYYLPNLLFDHPLVSLRLILLTAIVLPLAYLLALLRYRLLDVDRMISKTMAYVVLVIVFSLCYSVILVFLKRYFWGREIFSEQLFLLFMIGAVIVSNPLVGRLQRLIDSYFFHNRPDDSYLLLEFSRKIASSLHLPDLVEVVVNELPKEFQITATALMVIEEKKSRLYPERLRFGTRPWVDSRLVERLRQGEDYFFCQPVEDDPQLSRELQEIKDAGFLLVFGLRGSSLFTGILLLGPRKDGRFFRDDDIRSLATIANQAAIALENALHYESLAASKKQMEDLFGKVVQTEKMAALGEMTTVLAHELKNPMGIIRSSAQYLASGKRSEAVQHEMLHYIMDEVDNLNLIVTNILGLARYKTPIFSAIDLRKDITALIERWIRFGEHNQKVEIHCQVADRLPVLYADFRQLSQVILNLIHNSEDVMPDGGRIWIDVREEGENVLIRIRDNGPGISKEDLDKVFKKFFTTKEKGLGLGLSVCLQIVRAHNGHIRLKNMEFGGVEVCITIPFRPLKVVGRGLKKVASVPRRGQVEMVRQG